MTRFKSSESSNSMNIRFTTCGICLYFSLAAFSSLFGVHIHHSSHDNTSLQIHAEVEGNHLHCARHCKEENLLQHVLDGALNPKFELECIYCSYSTPEFITLINSRIFLHKSESEQSDYKLTLRHFLQPQAPPSC